MNFKNLKNFQIRKETILQKIGEVCSFHEQAKVVDLDTNEEDYISEDVVNMFFPLFDKYVNTADKRRGVLDEEVDKA